jgi:hypothetical protein
MPYEDPRLARESRVAAVGGEAVIAGLAVCFFLSACGGVASAQGVRPPVEADPVSGSVEVSARWRDLAGSEDLYRSMIDLGEGLKLNDLAVQYRGTPNATHPLLDSADIRLSSWVGEPASVLRAEWGLRDDYEAVVHYRRMAYFNRLSPVAPSGGPTGQWLDIDRGLFDAELTIKPRARVVPFFSVSRDSAKGPGKTTYVVDANEFSVLSATDTYANTFSGGFRLRFDRWTGSVDGGTTAFDDSQATQFSGDSTGNRTALFLGRRLRLTDLEQTYRIRGSDRFVRIRLEARPWQSFTFFGQFAFSQPQTTVNYSESSQGDFVLIQTLAAFTGQTAVGTGAASWPRSSGNAGVEYRPTNRIRIVESVSFERFHIAGSSEASRELSGSPTPTEPPNPSSAGRVESERTSHRLDATVELHRRVSLHGYHSYLNAAAASPGSALSDPEERTLDRHASGAGVTARPIERLELRADLEIIRGNNVFFRTDQRHDDSFALRGRYRISDALTAAVYGSIRDNTNQVSESAAGALAPDLAQQNRNYGAEVAYSGSSEWLEAVYAGYERSTFSSDVAFLIPQNFQTAESTYRERGHSSNLTALVRPHSRVELDAGGRLFMSTDEGDSGLRARPTRFYDVRLRLTFQVSSQLSWNGQWRWIEYSNRALSGESFLTHLFSTGLTYGF